MDARQGAQALGWFSIALGAAEVGVPQQLERLLGIGPHRTLLRALGVRELIPGAAILTQPDPTAWIWARVAGDVMDLGLLAAAFRQTTARTRLLAVSGSVAAITALDVVCAQRLSKR